MSHSERNARLRAAIDIRAKLVEIMWRQAQSTTDGDFYKSLKTAYDQNEARIYELKNEVYKRANTYAYKSIER